MTNTPSMKLSKWLRKRMGGRFQILTNVPRDFCKVYLFRKNYAVTKSSHVQNIKLGLLASYHKQNPYNSSKPSTYPTVTLLERNISKTCGLKLD